MEGTAWNPVQPETHPSGGADPAVPSLARPMLLRGPDRSPGCGSCPFGKDGKPSRPVPGEGPEKPLWIVVGEGPGSNERAQGRPFVGQSGKLLQRALDTNRAERESLWVTNALLCTPEGAGDAQKEAARVACAPRLQAELARFPGRPALLLGAAAARTLQIDPGAAEGPIETADPDAVAGIAFSEPEPEDVITSLLKNIKISKIAGALFIRDVDGTGPRPTIPTIHPAAILRGGAGGEMNARALDLLAWNLIADVGKVHRLATGRQEIFAETIEVEYEDSMRAAALVSGILAECRDQRFLALDLETTALRPREAEIRAVGLGHPGRSICVLWEILPPLARQALAEVLTDPLVAKCVHNRLYDVPVLEWRGFPVRGPIHCTLLGHHVIFPGLPHDLQRAATQFFAIPPWKAEFRGGEETPASLTRYCAIDTLACARLAKVEGRFISEGALGRAYDMYGSNAAMATRAMLTGIPLDLDENNRLDDLFVKVVEDTMASLLLSANDPAIRENLFQQVAMEQAKRARKGDAPDYPSRIAQRVRELMACVSCGGAGARPVAVNARCECEHPAGKHVSGPCSWSKFVKGKPEPERCACTSYRPRMKPCTACGGFGHPIFEWNPHTPDHVIGLLRARRVPLYFETKTGRVSTQRLILEALRRFPEVDQLLLFRDADKMLSTFVRKVRAAAVACPDGAWRFYPRIKVHTITARWAFEDPQCQNFPRANKRRGRPNLRAQVAAPPDQILVGFDFEKQEARIIGFYSADEYLCQHVSTLHEVLAREVWPPVQGFRCGTAQWVKGRDREALEGCPATGTDPGWRCGKHPEATPFLDVIAGFMGKKRDPELYDFVKRTEYGAFYEGSIGTLYLNLLKDDPTVKIADVARAVNVIKGRMPKVAVWQATKRAQVAVAPHRLRSFLFGVQRIWPLGNASPTEVANWDVQTMGSELMAEGFRRLVTWFETRYGAQSMEAAYPAFPNRFRILLQVHDAAYFLGPESEAPSMIEAIEACFPQEYTNPANGITMKFPIETKVGKSWADV